MKLRTALVSLGLTLLAMMASAGTVAQGFTSENGGAFTGTFNFKVSAGNYQGLLSTWSMAGADDITISSLTLSKGDVSHVFDGSAPDLLSWTGSTTEDYVLGEGLSLTAWLGTYGLSPVFLDEGDWQLLIKGATSNIGKMVGSYELSLNRVPEPQSLALVLLALLALAALRARQSPAPAARNHGRDLT